MSENIKDLRARFQRWKSALENKGLKVNIGKNKMMVSSTKMQCAVAQLAKPSLVEYAEKWLCLTQCVAHRVIRECMGDAT